MKNQHTHGPEYRNHIIEFSDKSAKGNEIEYMLAFLLNNALITIITMRYNGFFLWNYSRLHVFDKFSQISFLIDHFKNIFPFFPIIHNLNYTFYISFTYIFHLYKEQLLKRNMRYFSPSFAIKLWRDIEYSMGLSS